MSPKKVTTALAFKAYDELISEIATFVESNKLYDRYCDSHEFSNRIVQQITSDLLPVFTKMLIEQKTCSLSVQKICASLYSVDFKKSQISFNFFNSSKRFIFIFCFLIFNFFCLFYSLFRRSPATSTPSTILLIGDSDWHLKGDSFVEFCKEGPVTPLNFAERLIVQANKLPDNANTSEIGYHKFSIHQLANKSLCRADRFMVLLMCVKSFWWFVTSVLKSRTMLLLDPREVAWVPITAWLNKKRLIKDVVGTNSTFQVQHLWARGLSEQNFKFHMVWYSQNFIPKLYSGETEIVSFPSARHMRVDHHWVWTQGFCDYLRSIGQRNTISVVGPLLWYPQPSLDLASNKCSDLIKIAVFDVTPVSSKLDTFGAFKNYYTSSVMKMFVSEILSAASALSKIHGVKFKIMLKRKRSYDKFKHDADYFEYLVKLEQKHDCFEIVSHDLNLYSFIAKSHLSIAIPYTSTCYIAAALKKPSIYFDPFGELNPKYEQSPWIHFSSKPQTLQKTISKLLFSYL